MIKLPVVFNILLHCLDLPPTLKTISVFNLLKLTLVHTIVSVRVGV